jgi:hypothetical protein
MIQLSHTFAGLQEPITSQTSIFHNEEDQYRNYAHITQTEPLTHLQNSESLMLSCEISTNPANRFHRHNNNFEVNIFNITIDLDRPIFVEKSPCKM